MKLNEIGSIIGADYINRLCFVLHRLSALRQAVTWERYSLDIAHTWTGIALKILIFLLSFFVLLDANFLPESGTNLAYAQMND